MAAFDAGTITLDTEGLHPEARSTIQQALFERDKANKAARFRRAEQENEIHGPDDVGVADRIFDLLFSRYVVVVKKYTRSLRVQSAPDEGNAQYTADARRFRRLKYEDLKAKFYPAEVTS